VKICAALAWFDEPVEFLTRCISSLEGIADEIIALDGAWEHFEGGHMSPFEQEETIWRAARKASITPRVFIPHKVWESQVHKRQRLMEMASEHADWILVIDGDEYVTYSEPATIRRDLAATDELCAYVAWKNLNRGETMLGTTPAGGLNRRLFRAGTTVRIVHSGYFYEGENVLLGDSLDLRHCLAMEHDNVNRGSERNERARQYRRDRERYGAENWVKTPA
jgi:hypothetical protein